MAASKFNRLLVERLTDLVAIAELSEGNGIPWPKGDEPVCIIPLGTKTPKKSIVENELKARDVKFLGVVLDADDDAHLSWELVKSWFADAFPDLPEQIPEAGYVSDVNLGGQRLGVWIMPDNRSVGTLETLLKKLVRAESNAVLEHAVKSCNESKTRGAPFKKVHEEKAHVFTWLAWQDEPGRNLNTVDFANVFDPKSLHAQPFIAWLLKLFDIQKP